MRTLTNERIEEIASFMEGSIQDYHFFLEEGEDPSIEDLDYLDELVFECNTCGWNYSRDELEISNLTSDQICWRCYEDEEE